MKRSCHPTQRGKRGRAARRHKMPRGGCSLRRSAATQYQWKYGARSDPLCQERDTNVASPASHGKETKLDPNTLSLSNAACAQVQARSIRLRFSLSFVALEDPCMASSA